MKPVNKGKSVSGFASHGKAKPELLHRLGKFCSYCECPGEAQQLHVEHIYPQADTAHPNLSTKWRNFLVSCGTCNTYKAKRLGNGRQHMLLRRYLWPHLDNTFVAFRYHSNGLVEVPNSLPLDLKALALSTREMLGLLESPAATIDYADTDIAYDGIKKREYAWAIAQRALDAYTENRTANQLKSLLDNAINTGHFSIWMEVFREHNDVRREFISAFKADPTCFDSDTNPIRKGRI